ncbi:hypothetical protein F4677DRAFT_446470 [Hypoxylon crocopeplum]|nr:hypothetical protein F4677DRAFT_446470 [Hypoxylon crocopeplum]
MTYEVFTFLSLNIVIDIIIIAMPMPVLWGLHMPTRKKIVVTVMLSIGIMTISAMTVRLAMTAQVSSSDFIPESWADILLVTLMELWLCVIAACIPTLAPILQKYVSPAWNILATRLSRTKNRGSNTKPTIGIKYSKKKYRETNVSLDRLPNESNDQIDLVPRFRSTMMCSHDSSKRSESGEEPGCGEIHVQKDFGLEIV